MEYIIYIFSLVFLFFVTKKFFFVTAKNKEVLEKEILKEEVVEEVIEKKVEIFYQLNVENIKLNLYPLSTFSHYRIRDSYRQIVLDNYWINEPFYSKFTKIIYYIDGQELWIKSPRSKEIILNMRKQNGEILKTNSLKVFDLKEVLYNLILEILEIKNQTKGILSKENIQNILLPSLIYTLSKCGNLHIKTTNENEVINILIEIFFSDLSEESKSFLTPRNNLNFEVITQIYNNAISNAREHPNTIYSKSDTDKIVEKLRNFPKKQLMSIK